MAVDEGAILCWVECASGERYALRTNVRGKIIEINEHVIKEPGLIVSEPFSGGFIAVILAKIPEGVEEMQSRLVTEEELEKRLKMIENGEDIAEKNGDNVQEIVEKNGDNTAVITEKNGGDIEKVCAEDEPEVKRQKVEENGV